MNMQQIKEALEAKGFEVSEELARQGYELYTLKAEGESLPANDKKALEAFTQKWTRFCETNTLWHIADQIGYKAGLWA